jgi:hypothetical protein
MERRSDTVIFVPQTSAAIKLSAAEETELRRLVRTPSPSRQEALCALASCWAQPKVRPPARSPQRRAPPCRRWESGAALSSIPTPVGRREARRVMTMSRPGAFGDMVMTAAVPTRRAEGRLSPPQERRRHQEHRAAGAKSGPDPRRSRSTRDGARCSLSWDAGRAQPGVARDGRCGARANGRALVDSRGSSRYFLYRVRVVGDEWPADSAAAEEPVSRAHVPRYPQGVATAPQTLASRLVLLLLRPRPRRSVPSRRGEGDGPAVPLQRRDGTTSGGHVAGDTSMPGCLKLVRFSPWWPPPALRGRWTTPCRRSTG